MGIKEELECSESVINFLLDKENPNGIPTPMQSKMESCLAKYSTNMVPFTHYLNLKYNLYDGSVNLQPNFFFREESINFYIRIIRKLKIDLLCQN